jgi:glycerol-3-phosphate dehydrogenase (NAD(P)+)
MVQATDHIAVLGSGSWGTALAGVLACNASRVTLWGRNAEIIAEIRETGQNKRYLPGRNLPAEVVATSDLRDVAGAQTVFVAVPSRAVRPLAVELAHARAIKPGVVVVSCAKGIERDTGLTMSAVLKQQLPDQQVAVLSGPNHAEEVADRLVTAVVVGASDDTVAEGLQCILGTPWVRPYTSDDVVGIEWGGAVKNVFAIAAGILDGLEQGDNAKAALVTRGLAEMTRLGVSLGGRSETFQGLSGVGDLIATCYSHHSRNYRVGLALGSGGSLDEILAGMTMVAEGVPNTESIYRWSREVGVRTPLIDEVYHVLFEGKSTRDALEALLTRDVRSEVER